MQLFLFCWGGYLDLLDLTLQFEWLVEKFNENIQYLEK